MQWHELEPKKNAIKFGHHVKTNGPALGGILKNSSWAWIVEDETLQIFSLKNGQLISSYTFSRNIYNCDSIVCVTELFSRTKDHDVILAVCLDYIPSNAETAVNKSSIAIYSVEHGSVISWIRLESAVTCMQFLSSKNCRRSLVQHFDGCLAVGTYEGFIFTIDLYLNFLLNLNREKQKQCLAMEFSTPSACHIVDYNLPLVEIHRIYKNILRERSMDDVVHFGVRMEVISPPLRIESFLPIDLIRGLAVGLEDGGLAIYDMPEMQMIYTTEHHEESQLLKMDFLEPTDDPRACFYLLTLHGDGKKVVTCLYSFMYEKRLADERGDIYFENFLHGTLKLEVLLGSNISTVITCQAITKPPKNADDDATCLFAISWNALPYEEIKLLILDINQWYKEEMPRALSPEQANSCLASFKIKNQKDGLDAFLNPATISHFNSMQRCEEHFFPNSLSFDLILLDTNSSRSFNWPGIQNKTLHILRSSTASLFLEPDILFEKIREARLLSQFTELNLNAFFSQNAKYEVLLSVALEHNCMGLLRDCARSWADGSFTCTSVLPSAGELSLKTLQNWIWKRASNIKARCNQLCEGILSSKGHPLDQREKKELGFITRQLRNLAELVDEITALNSKYQTEKEKDGSFHLAADYQELLIWLINIGLLPERSQRFDYGDMPSTSRNGSRLSSIYPYKQLRDYYIQRRSAIAKVDECYISKKSGCCRLIFIDAFIEHECMRHNNNAGSQNSDNLREYWLQNGGNGLYPPANIESMLRIMLLPSVSYESKCAILFYFFMDLHVALTDGDRHDGEDLKEIVENFMKFPTVFKLSPSLTKTLQAFWHLDHGNIVAAVDELLSPFNSNRKIEHWLIELMVESLLLQNGAHLALRILDAHSSLVAPSLKLNALLANNLIAEAFHFVRSKDDTELMKRFFTSCLKMGKIGVIRDLALNEDEGKLVEDLLRRIQLPGAENLHFVYLLQKSKYIEAVTFMDEISKGKNMHYGSDTEMSSIDAPHLVISAFNTTMTPVTQTLTDVYFRIRNKIKQRETQNRSPVPLSCQLIKQNANQLLGGIYHSSALSAHFASRYYDEELQYGLRNVHNSHKRKFEISPLSANNAPFLRKPQTEICREVFDRLDRQTLIYPQEFKFTEKRRISEMQKDDALETNGMNLSVNQKIQQPKRRRLLEEEFLSSFKHFQKNNIVLNDIGLNLTNEQPVDETFLTRPLPGNEKSKNSHEHHNIRALVDNELISILKSNTPEPTEQRPRRAETPGMEERSIRFTLPPALSGSNALNNSKPIQQDNEIEAIEEPEIKHRIITRSMSQESHTDDVITPKSTEPTVETPPSDETSIRCTIPLALSGLNAEINSKQIPDECMDVQIDEPQVIHRVVTRSITASSHRDDTNLTKYYSSLSTQNLASTSTSVAISSVQDSGISVTGKALSSQNSESVSLYQTARGKSLSPSAFGPKPRKPLSRMSAEPEERPKKRLTLEPISSIKNPSFYEKKLSSGLHTAPSSAQQHPRLPGILKITSVTTLSSAEFAPQICSSKVGVAHAKPLSEQLKMSERSTVVVNSGSISDMYLQSNIKSHSESGRIQPRDPLLSAYEKSEVVNVNKNVASVRPSLDTTLGMSLYDVTELNTTTAGNDDESRLVETTSSSEDQLCEESNDDNKEEESPDEEESPEEEEGPDEEDGPAQQERREEVIELLSSSEENDFNESEEDSSTENDAEELESENTTNDTRDEDDTHESTYNTTESNSEMESNVVDIVDTNEDTSASTEDIVLQQEVSSSSEEEFIKLSNVSSEPGATEIVQNVEIVTETPNEPISEEKTDEVIIESLESPCIPEGEENSSSQSKAVKNTVDADAVPREIQIISSNSQVLEANKQSEEEKKSSHDEIECPSNSEAVEATSSQTDKLFEENLESPALELEILNQEPKQTNDVQNIPKSQGVVEISEEEKVTIRPQETSGTTHEHVTNAEENIVSAPNDGVSEATPPTIEIPEFESKQVGEEESQNDFVHPDSRNALTTELNSKDLDASDRFDTPNASFHSIKADDNESPNKASPSVSAVAIAVSESIDKQDDGAIIQLEENSLKRLHNRRKRGQSVPPQPLLTNDDEGCLEIDSQTPKTRSKRGISVPPQTIDPVTPTRTVRKTPTASKRRRSINQDETESLTKSPSSSQSGRDTQKRISVLTPQLDSPALRTRSRLRTISESSDATFNSLNSPAISATKKRRPSVSSNISEHLHQVLTPKRTRRNSTSGQSDNDSGTPRSGRRLVLQAEENEIEDTQKIDKTNPSTSTEKDVDLFSSARRLTRTQRALLEKSEQRNILLNYGKDDHGSDSSKTSQLSTRSQRTQIQKSERKNVSSDNAKDDQGSVSSKTSQTSTRSKRLTTRAASVRSNQDDDDRASVSSSVMSETRRSSRRLRSQQTAAEASPSTHLISIPEDDVLEDAVIPPKRNKTVKK